MRSIAGIIVVFGSVIGGYVMHHGNLAVLWVPNEYIIIIGAAVGSFIIGNSTTNIKAVLKSMKLIMSGGQPFTKADYIELLLFMQNVFKLMKSKGMLAMESHIENPHESDVFNKYKKFESNHHAVTFFCDIIRLITMGMDDPYKLEDLMNAELEGHHQTGHEISSSIQTLADAFPALGIVAAVLGVIITMGSITEPPEILGGLIGSALVGTFLGVLLSYGIFGPIAGFLKGYFEREGKYFECLKIGMLAHVQGNAPVVSVEFARKVIPDAVRPSFKEVEEALAAQT